MDQNKQILGRCKFNLHSKTVTEWPEQTTFKFETRYHPQLSQEDIAFSNATPSGEMKVVISNSVVAAKLKIGEDYYIDIVKIPKPAKD